MPALLFEGTDDLKVSSVDKESETISISLCNNFPESEYSLLEINLTFEEVDELFKWVDKQRDTLREIRRHKENLEIKK
ncbi:MAG TPA: hypothetical protein VN703_09860 [Candidatus Sulfopaludibacter sp.]|nr:hypothetical protein [Candidatus Sulfopaludibacter sp.]